MGMKGAKAGGSLGRSDATPESRMIWRIREIGARLALLVGGCSRRGRIRAGVERGCRYAGVGV